MKQPRHKKSREDTAFLYVRLSRDDNMEGDSYSIQNQKKLLVKIAKEKGYAKHIVFCDDGISGVTMNRPDYQKMLQCIEAGQGSAVFVKDLSRLGRNYLEVGKLIEEYFPEHDIRLVAISDGIDTDEGENELTPIRNLFNEWYARDISKKRRISNKIRGTAGEPLSLPPYGYIKDPGKPKRWVIDAEAATVVRRIYKMWMDGLGTEQIAATLSAERVLTPKYYWRSKGINRGGPTKDGEHHCWNVASVVMILSTQEYCGDVINFKTFSKSYKNKKKIPNSEENILVFEGVHEPIIARELWESVQQKRGKTRKRKAKDGEKNLFSGVVTCADCGYNLHYHYNQRNHDIKYFNCANYKGNRGGTCSSTHYVRVDFLEQVVLGEIRRLTRFASRYEDAFVKVVIGHSKEALLSEKHRKQKELKTLLARDRESDTVIEHLYEDNVAGKLSDDRFMKMSKRYETEQGELVISITSLRAMLDQEKDTSVSTELFINTVRKYTRVRKLTPRMLNELIDRIEVYHAEKVDGIYVQKLRIHYNCVGAIEIPDELPLLAPGITLQTRKGVALSYSDSLQQPLLST